MLHSVSSASTSQSSSNVQPSSSAGRILKTVLAGSLLAIGACNTSASRRCPGFVSPMCMPQNGARFGVGGALGKIEPSRTEFGRVNIAPIGLSRLQPLEANPVDDARANRSPVSKVKIVKTIEDFKKEVIDEKKKDVAVMVFADWCRLCKKMKPAFGRLARENPEMKFLAVPYLPGKNDPLIKALTPEMKVPFGLIYRKPACEEGSSEMVYGDSLRLFEQFNATLQSELN